MGPHGATQNPISVLGPYGATQTPFLHPNHSMLPYGATQNPISLLGPYGDTQNPISPPKSLHASLWGRTNPHFLAQILEGGRTQQQGLQRGLRPRLDLGAVERRLLHLRVLLRVRETPPQVRSPPKNGLFALNLCYGPPACGCPAGLQDGAELREGERE